MPDVLSRTIGQSSTLSTSSEFGPRTSSSTGIARRPIRLVNQLESGTSSIVLTLTAGMSRRSPGLPNVCSDEVEAVAAFDRPGRLASNAASLSVWIGSSGKKRGTAVRCLCASATKTATAPRAL
jgi:hypothetical protein